MKRPKWFNNGRGPFPSYEPKLSCGRVFQPGRVVIYALVDPFDGTVRYVGKTSRQQSRFAEHWDLLTTNFNLRWWLESLRKANAKPRMAVLCRCLDAEWETAERAWISAYAARGELYNWEEGGKHEGPKPQGRRKRLSGGCPVCKRLRQDCPVCKRKRAVRQGRAAYWKSRA
jgi:hypothetical protein